VPALTPTEIYNVCLQAGFSRDQAVTWTAIAMAESGGNTDAHNPHGEDSRGLWQINVDPSVRDNPWGDLSDPLNNARAAYAVSHQGTDLRPWTVTHASNAGTAHDYRQFMDEARAAAGGSYAGDFSGVSGYDDPNPGGAAEAGTAPGATAPPAPAGPDADHDGATDAFEMSRGTDPQVPDSDHDGLTDGFELGQGSDPLGADTDHDGLSDAYEHQIGSNALVADSDGDGVADAAEVAAGRDPLHGIAGVAPGGGPIAAVEVVDSDHDGLSDAFEAALGTNALLADTDGDGVNDALEHSHGSDPLHVDSDGDGIVDGVDIDDDVAIGLGGLGTIGGPAPAAGGAPGAAALAAPAADPLHPAEAGPLAPEPADHGVTQTFLDAALAQAGDPYVWGSEASPDDANPTAFDCSELAQWAAGRVGVDLPDGSWLQYLQLKEQGAVIPVDQAVHTPGALLFRFETEPTAGGGRPGEAHVAISLGDGNTIEARGRAYGVGSWEAGDRFTYAAVIPGVSGGDVSLDAATIDALAAPAAPLVDADGDGVPDPYEMAGGTNPMAADSDGDGLTDGFEMAHTTNALAVDSDGDGLSDAFEVQVGINALDPDADHDGLTDAYELATMGELAHDPAAAGLPALQGLPGIAAGGSGTVDSDGDGLSDAWESSLGTNPLHDDSDADGLSDALEEARGSDPLLAANPDDEDDTTPEP
jgi:cell wall-associated NlpC family hydrolase